MDPTYRAVAEFAQTWGLAYFVVVFLLVGSAGLLLFYREAMLQRISDVINPQPKPKTLLGTIQQAGFRSAW